ncbi:hypothetical protein [Megamonas funiformis]|uniref:hypothetical protein n=1 Tax=Megamonas funiformis TaxID=437897 RepID=UPI003521E162
MNLKILIISILIIFVSISNNLCFADEWEDALNEARTAGPIYPMENIVSTKGVEIDVKNIYFGPYFDYAYPKEEIYGTKMRAVCITGFGILINNKSDKVVTINWNKSVICVDGISLGIPFTDGIKYIDAGKENIIPSSILPPNSILVRNLYIPQVHLRPGDFSFKTQWVIDGAILLKNKSRKFDFYIATEYEDGINEYIHVDIPPISVQ